MNKKSKRKRKLASDKKRKRKYYPPMLTEYGKLFDLTKGALSGAGDGGSGMMP